MIAYCRLRDTISGAKGTFGVWLDGQIPFAVGLEPSKPIIPAGQYLVSWYLSPKRGTKVYLIENVPGHQGVEIHVGNQTQDTDGCLLIGLGYGVSTIHGVSDSGVILSGSAFQILRIKAGIDKSWPLVIKEI